MPTAVCSQLGISDHYIQYTSLLLGRMTAELPLRVQMYRYMHAFVGDVPSTCAYNAQGSVTERRGARISDQHTVQWAGL